MAQERPVHEFRLGKAKAVVWKNETDVGVRYGVTFARIYLTAEGWQTSASFGRDELMLVAKVADMAHTWIYQQNDRVETSDGVRENKSRSSPDARRESSGSR